MANEAVSEKDTVLYRISRGFAWLLVHLIMPVRYHGKEKLQNRQGPYVLISNHRHALDPVVLAWPVPSQCVFLGKKELAKSAFLKKCLTDLHCILVDRHNRDMEAMRSCMKAVKMGKVLVVFPEGTRHHEGQMEQIENGTSLIVMRGRVPVIPVYLDGKLKLFRRINAYVGDPIEYSDLLVKGINVESCEEMNERMRETFRKMIAETAEHPS
ncbi:MAG: 1-acyl-sn-glycerol-3-phosphate acyltransferase [Clostridia bacterium]|nr:1-acyl-sn-glycerol-3-phosphate acyltransferase [Clostridia bacterium]